MKKVISSVAVLTLCLFASSAHAFPILSETFTDSIGNTTTNWNSTVTIPKFDATLGTLLSIEFTLKSTVQGTAQYESLDAAPTSITLNLSSIVQLQRPDNSLILQVLPVASVTDNATAFDGTINFDGPSGGTFNGLLGQLTATGSSPPPISDLALFTGLGNILLPVVATGVSSGSGAGNLLLQFATSADAMVTVKYNYETVPEPTTLASLAIGGLAMLVRRRR